LRVCFAEGTAKNREVLCEHIDEPPVDSAISSDDTVTGILLLLHTEIETAVFDELVDLLE
jgi:hypothetical protein